MASSDLLSADMVGAKVLGFHPSDVHHLVHATRYRNRPLDLSDSKKTILIGKCIYQVNKDNPDIKEMISAKGCPPKAEAVVKAFHRAGIQIDSTLFENIDQVPGSLCSSMKTNLNLMRPFSG